MTAARHQLNSRREQVLDWLASATSEQRREYDDVIRALSERSPKDMTLYNLRPMPGDSRRMVADLPSGLQLVWADLPDYPGYFNVTFVGRLDLA